MLREGLDINIIDANGLGICTITSAWGTLFGVHGNFRLDLPSSKMKGSKCSQLTEPNLCHDIT